MPEDYRVSYGTGIIHKEGGRWVINADATERHKKGKYTVRDIGHSVYEVAMVNVIHKRTIRVTFDGDVDCRDLRELYNSPKLSIGSFNGRNTSTYESTADFVELFLGWIPPREAR